MSVIVITSILMALFILYVAPKGQKINGLIGVVIIFLIGIAIYKFGIYLIQGRK